MADALCECKIEFCSPCAGNNVRLWRLQTDAERTLGAPDNAEDIDLDEAAQFCLEAWRHDDYASFSSFAFSQLLLRAESRFEHVHVLQSEDHFRTLFGALRVCHHAPRSTTVQCV